MKVFAIMVIGTAVFLLHIDAADLPKKAVQASATAWGEIAQPNDKKLAHRRVIKVNQWPANRLLDMPVPFPNIASGWVMSGGNRQPLYWMFNQDASIIKLGLPPIEAAIRKDARIHLITAEKSGEQADGTIVLSALDARVIGAKARLETHPGNHRIGFWVNPQDYVRWEFPSKGKGLYEVEIAYSQAGPPGTVVTVQIDDKPVGIQLGGTGSWYAYTSQRTGRIRLAGGTAHTGEVKCEQLRGGAVMNLKAIILHPVQE